MNVFTVDETMELTATADNASDTTAKAVVSVKLLDFFDQPAGEKTVEITVPAKSQASATVWLSNEKKGFFRTIATVAAGGVVRTHVTRTAVVEPYGDQDSIFGVNHAYPWDDLLRVREKISLPIWRGEDKAAEEGEAEILLIYRCSLTLAAAAAARQIVKVILSRA